MYAYGDDTYCTLYDVVAVRELEEQRRVKIKNKIKQLNEAKLQVSILFAASYVC